MAEKCQLISKLSVSPSILLGSFLYDISKLGGNPGELDTCDLKVFQKELGISLPQKAFLDKFGKGDSFKLIEASEFLYNQYLYAPNNKYYAFYPKYFSNQTHADLAEVALRDLKTTLEPIVEVGVLKKIPIYERILKEPALAEWLSVDEKEKIGADIAKIRELFEEKNWKDLYPRMDTFEVSLPDLYETISQRAQDNVKFWERAVVATEVVHNVLFIGAGVAVGIVAGPVAAVGATLAFGLSSLASEETAKAISQDDYTWQNALKSFGYHAPFDIIKSAAFLFPPLKAATIFVGATFVEVAADPFGEPKPVVDRLIDGGFSALVAAATFFVGKKAGEKLGPYFAKYFRRAIQPVPESPQLVRPTVVETRTATSPSPPVEPPPPKMEVEPAPPPPTPKPKRVEARPKNGGPNGASHSEKVLHTIKKTRFAEDCFEKLTPLVKGKMEEFVATLVNKLNFGVPIAKIANVMRNKDFAGVWEGRFMSASNARVYFKITDDPNGSKIVEILGYSLGEADRIAILQHFAGGRH